VFSAEALICASLEPVEKGGANAGPGKVAESRESAGLGAVLDVSPPQSEGNTNSVLS